ncbi:MAG: hypothetical protein WBO26_10845 [Providencia rettgeri]|uniref:hypothetical protein n=1 Tax=unclassified Providencia TaxID=2633465 RepID=UPI00234AA45E|nr:hypothetical protein [Providencia sp. PROV164]
MIIKHKEKTFLLKGIPLLLSILMPNIAQSGITLPPISLVLQGLIDLDEPKGVNQPYLVEGRLTGGTTITRSPIYASYAQQTWTKDYSLLSISTSSTRCAGNIGERIVNTNRYGFPLVHSRDSGLKAWIIPSIRYHIALTGAGAGSGGKHLKTSYSGKLFTTEHDGLVDLESWYNQNTCLIPGTDIATTGGGTKVINLYADGKFELYTNKTISPGRLSYTGNKLYIVTHGNSTDVDATAPLNFVTDLNIVRICKISQVVNDNINVTIGRDNQVIEESSFQYTCTGENKDLAMSAVVKEGTLKSDPTKLFFDTLEGKPASSPPWLMGMPYREGDDSTFSCKDENKKGMINFNNQPVDFSFKSISNIAQTMRIKWAICSNDNVTPGKYRARVELAVYTKV